MQSEGRLGTHKALAWFFVGPSLVGCAGDGAEAHGAFAELKLYVAV